KWVVVNIVRARQVAGWRRPGRLEARTDHSRWSQRPAGSGRHQRLLLRRQKEESRRRVEEVLGDIEMHRWIIFCCRQQHCAIAHQRNAEERRVVAEGPEENRVVTSTVLTQMIEE